MKGHYKKGDCYLVVSNVCWWWYLYICRKDSGGGGQWPQQRLIINENCFVLLKIKIKKYIKIKGCHIVDSYISMWGNESRKNQP